MWFESHQRVSVYTYGGTILQHTTTVCRSLRPLETAAYYTVVRHLTLELYYMPTVRTFDFDRVKKLIAESDPYLQQYIKSLQGVSDGWERLAKDAVAKLKRNAQQTKAKT